MILDNLLILNIFILLLFYGIYATEDNNNKDDCSCGNINRPKNGNSVGEGLCSNSQDEKEKSTYLWTIPNEMVLIEGGIYHIGTNKPVFIRDGEGPKRSVILNSFYIDKFEVNNKNFQAFVESNDYKTEAETFGNSFVFEGLLSEEIKSGIKEAVAQAPWWLPVNGATWRHPEGLHSDIKGRLFFNYF